jgi:hypothetical protein
MNRRTIYGWTAMTALGLLAGVARADETVVRVSDSPPAGTSAPSAMAPSATAPSAVASPSGAPSVDGTVTGQCDNGAVAGGVAVGGDVGIYRIGAGIQNLMLYNPARGFRPPTTVHVEREAIMYYNYWPAKWYGQPGWHLAPSYPMVYMPTDTTQLGVYYARVPQWQPNPRMYPRPPRPDEWNRRVSFADGGCGGACYGAATPASYGPASPTPDTMGAPVAPPTAAGSPAPLQTIQPAPKMAPPPAPQGN